MCESSAYLLKGAGEELILEGIDVLEEEDGLIRLVSMFGEEKTLRAKIKVLSLLDHKILLEPLEQGESA
jgi:predicted RNA-binding protein